MELAGLLRQGTVENAFVVGLLLTGSMKQAEDAVVETIDCSDTKQICGEQLLQGVIRSSLRSKQMVHAPEISAEASSAMLPLELRRVMNLPRDLRVSFVLRMLLGLPREVCAWLLHIEPEEVRRRTQEAMTKLAGLHPSRVDVTQHSKGQRSESALPYLANHRVVPDSPAAGVVLLTA
jgi:hypothetical protein